MHKRSFKLAALSYLAGLAAAQTTVTLYDLSLAAPSGTGLPGQLEDVLFDIDRGAADFRASAVAVDLEGVTYYVGERPVSVVPTTASGRLTTAILSTPFTETVTFRADASRIFNQAKATTTIDGLKAVIDVSVICTHDVDDDTSVEDAEIVCRQKGVIDLDDGAAGTTVFATTTGDVKQILTVTNAANLTLPTTDARPFDLSEPTTSSRTRTQVTSRPSDSDDDNEPSPTPTSEPDTIDDGGASRTTAGFFITCVPLVIAALASL